MKKHPSRTRTSYAVDNSNTNIWYHSPHTLKECIDYLSHKNVNDTQQYEFERTEDGEHTILFQGESQYAKNRFRSCYALDISAKAQGCILHLVFRNESMRLPFPLIAYFTLDKFFKVKLNAKRIREEDVVKY